MLAIALFVIVCISLSGCTKTWSVVFEDVYDLAGWNIYIYDAEAKYYIDSNGLMLDAYGAEGPIAFSGDVTMSIDFEMFSSPSNPIQHLSFAFTGYPGDDYLSMNLYDFCSETEERYVFYDGSFSNKVEFNTPVPGINYIGTNSLTFSKTNNNVTIKLNGTEIYNSPYSFFSSDYVVPLIGAVALQSSGYVLFKNIKVQYSGEMIAL